MKILTLASILSVSALTLMPCVASADPVGVKIDVKCPAAGSNGPDALANFGDVIAGYGQEVVTNQNNPIYFKSTAPLAPNTPSKLSNYRNDSVDYDSTTGTVSCNYVSLIYPEPRISVSYVLTNGKGGIVTNQAGDYVSITLPVGFRN